MVLQVVNGSKARTNGKAQISVFFDKTDVAQAAFGFKATKYVVLESKTKVSGKAKAPIQPFILRGLDPLACCTLLWNRLCLHIEKLQPSFEVLGTSLINN